jgi:MtN3 and saliva related transmembrane protein
MSLKYGEHNPSPIQSVINNVEPPLLPTYIYVIGVLAGTLTCLAFLPQVIKAVKTRTASSLTWITLSICVVGQSMWITYGSLTKDKILIIFSMITLLFYVCLIGSKMFFRNQVTS